MRISLVCISLRGGGTERIVCRMANYLVARHDATIITLAPGECFYELHPKVRVVQPVMDRKPAAKPLRVLSQMKHLFTASRREGAEVCLIFGEDITAIGILLARLAGTRTVWGFFRGTPQRSLSGLTGALNPWACKLASRVVVQTAAARTALAGAYPTERLHVWPNPIEVPEHFTPQAARQSMILNIGSIGRLKNQEALLRIFKQLHRGGNWRLTFVGDGPGRLALEAESAKFLEKDTVFIAGEVRDVAAYFSRAKIFAFTSLSEGFPNALAEAMAAGCACISYDCPTGPSELIEHGVSGFLVEPGDEAEYARLLQRLIDEPHLRERFSRNARKSMERFEESMVMDRLEELIEDAAGHEKMIG